MKISLKCLDRSLLWTKSRQKTFSQLQLTKHASSYNALQTMPFILIIYNFIYTFFPLLQFAGAELPSDTTGTKWECTTQPNAARKPMGLQVRYTCNHRHLANKMQCMHVCQWIASLFQG